MNGTVNGNGHVNGHLNGNGIAAARPDAKDLIITSFEIHGI
jgi:hypothetical protein